MGKGWEKDNGIYYSNHTWAYKKYVYTGNAAGFSGSWNRAWWDDGYEDDLVWDKATNRYVQRNALKSAEAKKADSKADTKKTADPWGEYYSDFTGRYYFEDNCPGIMDGDYSYCALCSQCAYCYDYKACQAVKNVNKAAEA